MARKYHEKACKRSVMRKKKVVMISVGHRRKKIQVQLVKIGPLIDNIIIVITIIIIIMILIMMMMMMMMMITIITIVILLLLYYSLLISICIAYILYINHIHIL